MLIIQDSWGFYHFIKILRKNTTNTLCLLPGCQIFSKNAYEQSRKENRTDPHPKKIKK